MAEAETRAVLEAAIGKALRLGIGLRGGRQTVDEILASVGKLTAEECLQLTRERERLRAAGEEVDEDLS